MSCLTQQYCPLISSYPVPKQPALGSKTCFGNILLWFKDTGAGGKPWFSLENTLKQHFATTHQVVTMAAPNCTAPS